jgi:hypothetical protein
VPLLVALLLASSFKVWQHPKDPAPAPRPRRHHRDVT